MDQVHQFVDMWCTFTNGHGYVVVKPWMYCAWTLIKTNGSSVCCGWSQVGHVERTNYLLKAHKSWSISCECAHVYMGVG